MDLSGLKSIPQERLLIYICILGLLPLLLVAFFIFSGLESLGNLEMGIQNLQLVAMQKEKKQAANRALRTNFKDSEHLYIDKNLETLSFLQSDVENLKKISSDPNFTQNEAIRKRLEFLTSSKNRLTFIEGAVQSTPQFQEMTETLAHPVEVNVKDVQQILSYIEGIDIGPFKPPPGRPQLLILDFQLNRKIVSENNEVFELNMKLLKREFS